MNKLKTYVEEHKVEFGLFILGTSLASYYFLKQKKNISSWLFTPTEERLKYSKGFIKTLQRTPLGLEEESNILKSIDTYFDQEANTAFCQIPKDSYINVKHLLELLHNSKALQLDYDVLYSYSTPSTQTITSKHFEDYENPLVYIANTQTQGRGRRNNSWESPKGCLLVTFTSIVKTEFLVVMQYLTSLAIHEAILELTNEKFKLKWPNDTYYESFKIAGNMIQASDLRTSSEFKKLFIGFGVNVDNQQPTISINQILQKQGKPEIKAEQLLVTILEKFGENLFTLESDGWEKGLAQRYFSYWEDFGVEATLLKGEESELVRINGIDVNGNLILINPKQESITINPNFYSYDCFKKIFYPK